ncbi:hypothetical protein [Bartonella harrusi]|uniref:Uncharacterized protein n=1 Tax=Bartonella harrusi TaxID=2961895 RepID=A0ABY5ETT5_9HYPH|nr:hypothetical protein [Bartonella harrusi]UTO28554.1 hypothetical protein NMK50_00475 [Bartonella harrusi]
MGLSVLRKVDFFKKAGEYVAQWYFGLYAGYVTPSLTNVTNKSVRQFAYLYYLKDIAVDTFGSRKAELKMMLKMDVGFLLKLHIFS